MSVIDDILSLKTFAVAGVSRDTSKWGYRVFDYLRNAGYDVYAINPNSDCIDDGPCYPSISALPTLPECLITVTQPWITAGLVKEAAAAGVPYVWMQPGSEPRQDAPPRHDASVERGLQIVHGGPCIIVEHLKAQRRAAS
jgi:uncharacterized protein